MLLTLHLALTCVLTGLIWTIQIVHYPLMAHLPPAAFASYHREHLWRITLLVGPLIVGEAISAGWLWWQGLRDTAFLWSLPLMVITWLSSALWQVPLHHRLATQDFDPTVHQRLVRTNWCRTLAWTARAALLLSIVIGRPRL